MNAAIDCIYIFGFLSKFRVGHSNRRLSNVKKSVNLRAIFDKNKKASRIKALREFTMKRLTDFFGEKG